MNKNQNLYYKFLALALFLSMALIYPIQAQENTEDIFFNSGNLLPEQRLHLADSLFDAQEYTASFGIYSNIFEEQKSSPGMLLKMAYIQEGLGNFTEALYYLNLYYLHTSNKTVLVKMEELAEKNNLQGYAYTDTDMFLAFYYKHQFELTIAILALTLFMFSFIYYQKKKKQKRPVLPGILYVALLGCLYVLINYGSGYNKGIISSPSTYLMKGPSSGASLLEVISQGHRVKILGKEDVWVKINWNGNIAFVRENSIQQVRL